jgi:hypothetical protein
MSHANRISQYFDHDKHEKYRDQPQWFIDYDEFCGWTCEDEFGMIVVASPDENEPFMKFYDRVMARRVDRYKEYSFGDVILSDSAEIARSLERKVVRYPRDWVCHDTFTKWEREFNLTPVLSEEDQLDWEENH